MSESIRVPEMIRTPLLSADSGPGLRWLIFLQGCRRPCTTRCLNPAFLDARGGCSMPIADLLVIAGQVAAGTWGRAEGVTLLGGEPTDQAAALVPLLRGVRALGLSVMLYSGHRLRWFHRPENVAATRLLDLADLLVDGPFLPELADPRLRWRGSRNQRIIRLTDRYSVAALERDMSVRGITLSLGPGHVIMSGLQERRIAARAERLVHDACRTIDPAVTHRS